MSRGNVDDRDGDGADTGAGGDTDRGGGSAHGDRRRGQGDIDGRDDDGGEVDIIFGSYDAEALEGDDPGVDVDGYMYRDVDAKG